MDKYIGVAFADMVANLLQNELSFEFDSALLHGYMGIASESAELLEIHQELFDEDTSPCLITTLIELSDLLHFVQAILGKLDISLMDILEDNKRMPPHSVLASHHDKIRSCLIKLASSSGEQLNRYKKFIFYHGEKFTRPEMIKGMSVVVHYIAEMANLMCSSIDEIMVINLAKLRARYPNGYSHDKAMTHKRDKKKERADIEEALGNYRRSQQ